MRAYQDALNATSRPHAPWYAIPADDKPYTHLVVAEIIVATMKQIGLRYPALGAAEKARLAEMRELLEQEPG